MQEAPLCIQAEMVRCEMVSVAALQCLEAHSHSGPSRPWPGSVGLDGDGEMQEMLWMLT